MKQANDQEHPVRHWTIWRNDACTSLARVIRSIHLVIWNPGGIAVAALCSLAYNEKRPNDTRLLGEMEGDIAAESVVNRCWRQSDTGLCSKETLSTICWLIFTLNTRKVWVKFWRTERVARHWALPQQAPPSPHHWDCTTKPNIQLWRQNGFGHWTHTRGLPSIRKQLC